LVGKALELCETPAELELAPDALVVFWLPSVGKGELKLQSADLGQGGLLPGADDSRSPAGRASGGKGDLTGSILTERGPYRTF
jgi:hypothetical protein